MRMVKKQSLVGLLVCVVGSVGSVGSACSSDGSTSSDADQNLAMAGSAPTAQASAQSANADATAEPASAGAAMQPASSMSSTPAGASSAGASTPATADGQAQSTAPAAAQDQAASQLGAAGAEAAMADAPGADEAAAGAAAPPVPTEKFSFFVTSLQGMLELSDSDQGFGGDLRYGEETGLAGADKICTELAEKSMPGAGGKGWHAFLSTAKGGEDGGPTHAKDRIGAGPWYDRLGRLVAMNVSDLLQPRPAGADPAIMDDLPNERGEPNHTDTMEGMDDNHDVVTATNEQGEWDGQMTCEDWTSTETPEPEMDMGGMMGMGGPRGGFFGGDFSFAGPGLGHSWPSQQSGVSWMKAHPAPGCGPSVALVQTGPGSGTGIGNAGGYGGIYCFALQP